MYCLLIFTNYFLLSTILKRGGGQTVNTLDILDTLKKLHTMEKLDTLDTLDTMDTSSISLYAMDIARLINPSHFLSWQLR